MTDHQSRYTNMMLMAEIRNKALERKQGRNLSRRLKLIRTVLEDVSYSRTRGQMLRSKTALMMERTEKMTEAMGTEGRHATRPRLSVTQVDFGGSFHGKVKIPLIIRNNNRTTSENQIPTLILNFTIYLVELEILKSHKLTLSHVIVFQDSCISSYPPHSASGTT